MKKALSIIKTVLPLLVTAILGTVIVSQNISFLQNLSKPPWYPPQWFFPAAWTAVFALLGWGYWLVTTRDRSGAQNSAALADTFSAFYYLQLFLNFFWVYLFFGLGFMWVAFFEGLLLIYFTGRMIFTAKKLHPKGWIFMIPYLLQSLFGIFGLNLFIAVMN